jgi:hypothetical protein
MWKYRCNIKYRKINQTVYRTNIIEPKVIALYNQQANLDKSGRLYFERPMVNVLEQKIPYIHQWIKKTEDIIAHSIQRCKKQLLRIPKLGTFFPKIHTKNKKNTAHSSQTKSNTPTTQLDQGVSHNLEETRPLPPPQPDPGNTRNALIDLLVKPP